MTSGTPGRVSKLSPAEVNRQLEEGTAVLVDVREPEEFGAAHIPNARLMPLGLVDSTTVPTLADQAIVLYCRSGNRSEMAADVLIASGRDDVHHLDGGIRSWKAAGFALTGQGGGVSIMRQVQMVVGIGVLASVVLGLVMSAWFLAVAAFFGAGLAFAGLTGTCGLAMILKRMPWNQPRRSCRRTAPDARACCG